MTEAERELLVHRIGSGLTRVRVEGDVYYLRGPTPQERYEAALVYEEQFADSAEQQVLTEVDALAHLMAQGLWSENDEKELKTLEDNIDKLKVGLFRSLLREHDREMARKTLHVTRQRFEQLFLAKHQLDHLTCSGIAQLAKTKYLASRCLLDEHHRPVWPNHECWRKRGTSLLDKALSTLAKLRVTEKQYRELARKEPWRSLWSCKTVEGAVFGKPATELSDEQRTLILWSKIYDSAFEHPDCPDDFVIQDDDMFDGWMIVQREEREKQQKERAGAKATGNEKINNSGEVFHIAQSDDDVRRIEEMNSVESAALKKQRMKYLKKEGVVQEGHMPDSRIKIRAEAMAKFAQGMRG